MKFIVKTDIITQEHFSISRKEKNMAEEYVEMVIARWRDQATRITDYERRRFTVNHGRQLKETKAQLCEIIDQNALLLANHGGEIIITIPGPPPNLDEEVMPYLTTQDLMMAYFLEGIIEAVVQEKGLDSDSMWRMPLWMALYFRIPFDKTDLITVDESSQTSSQ